MAFRLLADLLVVAHLAFILFVLLGGLLALRRWWIALVHLPAAIWGVVIEVSGSVCPLTPLENILRRLSGSQGYTGSFVEYYLMPVLYPSGLTRDVQLALAAIVLVVNVVVYGVLLQRLARRGINPHTTR